MAKEPTRGRSVNSESIHDYIWRRETTLLQQPELAGGRQHAADGSVPSNQLQDLW